MYYNSVYREFTVIGDQLLAGSPATMPNMGEKTAFGTCLIWDDRRLLNDRAY